MAVAEAAIAPIWSYSTPHDKSTRLPWRWRFVPNVQREVYALVWLERELSNGGFAQFFDNPRGFFVAEILDGCQRFDIPAISRLVQDASKIFPGGVVPLRRVDRQHILHRRAVELVATNPDFQGIHDYHVLNDLHFDSRSVSADENTAIESMYRQTARYIRTHPNEFFR